MDLATGSEGLDPGIDLEFRPDSLSPVNIRLNKVAHNGLFLGFKNPKDVSTPLCWPKCDQGSLLLERLQAGEMLFSVITLSAVYGGPNGTCEALDGMEGDGPVVVEVCGGAIVDRGTLAAYAAQFGIE